jgi:hypothetical protein
MPNAIGNLRGKFVIQPGNLQPQLIIEADFVHALMIIIAWENNITAALNNIYSTLTGREGFSVDMLETAFIVTRLDELIDNLWKVDSIFACLGSFVFACSIFGELKAVF